MTTAEIIEHLAELECLVADGFEEALIGIVDGACRSPVACYDYDRCIQILVERDGMDEEMAEEYMQFNVVGAYVGEMTPLFLPIGAQSRSLPALNCAKPAPVAEFAMALIPDCRFTLPDSLRSVLVFRNPKKCPKFSTCGLPDLTLAAHQPA